MHDCYQVFEIIPSLTRKIPLSHDIVHCSKWLEIKYFNIQRFINVSRDNIHIMKYVNGVVEIHLHDLKLAIPLDANVRQHYRCDMSVYLVQVYSVGAIQVLAVDKNTCGPAINKTDPVTADASGGLKLHTPSESSINPIALCKYHGLQQPAAECCYFCL